MLRIVTASVVVNGSWKLLVKTTESNCVLICPVYFLVGESVLYKIK